MNTLIDPNQLPSTRLGSQQSFDDTAKGAFRGRLVLYSKQPEVTDGLITAGNWGIKVSATEIINLGEQCDILPLAMRHKAIDASNKQDIRRSFDKDSAEYQAIARKSDSNTGKAFYGVEFLVVERTTGRILELFYCNASSRRAAKEVFPYLPLSAVDIAAMGDEGSDLEPHGPVQLTVKCGREKNSKGTWHVPVALKCSNPIVVPKSVNINQEILDFINVNEGVATSDAAGSDPRS